MRVLVCAVSPSAGISGVQRHGASLVHCLLTQSEIKAIDLVVAPWQVALFHAAGCGASPRVTLHSIDVRPGALACHWWYRRHLPAVAAALQPDILHLTLPMPIDRRRLRVPVIMTLHDLYPFEIPANFRPMHAVFHRFLLRRSLRSADAIACVSSTTQSELNRRLPSLAANHIAVVPNCVEPQLTPVAFPRCARWQDDPFLLLIAQHRRNKNILLALQSFALLLRSRRIPAATRLVVVGMAGPETARIRRAIIDRSLQPHVLLLENLREEELHWCYRNAALLLAPSSTEGFGLPVAEALLAGCRIVCSDIGAFRELAGLSGLLNDNCTFIPLLGTGDAQRFADAVADALRLPRPEPVELPALRATHVAEAYHALYRRMLQAAPMRTLAPDPMHIAHG